ncbi:hypothetical protein BU16DRAFT_538001 [Lophium mytilinum]|uniref:Uncharacterized protein n=1 Tax=Lophium mytilinum TaxID=390894 RepID=A0A6A6QWP6_9PEZI|nr:hypothetical protein BU16DRAFT_538001 [Lophium mytilinum]
MDPNKLPNTGLNPTMTPEDQRRFAAQSNSSHHLYGQTTQNSITSSSSYGYTNTQNMATFNSQYQPSPAHGSGTPVAPTSMTALNQYGSTSKTPSRQMLNSYRLSSAQAQHGSERFPPASGQAQSTQPSLQPPGQSTPFEIPRSGTYIRPRQSRSPGGFSSYAAAHRLLDRPIWRPSVPDLTLPPGDVNLWGTKQVIVDALVNTEGCMDADTEACEMWRQFSYPPADIDAIAWSILNTLFHLHRIGSRVWNYKTVTEIEPTSHKDQAFWDSLRIVEADTHLNFRDRYNALIHLLTLSKATCVGAMYRQNIDQIVEAPLRSFNQVLQDVQSRRLRMGQPTVPIFPFPILPTSPAARTAPSLPAVPPIPDVPIYLTGLGAPEKRKRAFAEEINQPTIKRPRHDAPRREDTSKPNAGTNHLPKKGLRVKRSRMKRLKHPRHDVVCATAPEIRNPMH